MHADCGRQRDGRAPLLVWKCSIALQVAVLLGSSLPLVGAVKGPKAKVSIEPSGEFSLDSSSYSTLGDESSNDVEAGIGQPRLQAEVQVLSDAEQVSLPATGGASPPIGLSAAAGFDDQAIENLVSSIVPEETEQSSSPTGDGNADARPLRSRVAPPPPEQRPLLAEAFHAAPSRSTWRSRLASTPSAVLIEAATPIPGGSSTKTKTLAVTETDENGQGEEATEADGEETTPRSDESGETDDPLDFVQAHTHGAKCMEAAEAIETEVGNWDNPNLDKERWHEMNRRMSDQMATISGNRVRASELEEALRLQRGRRFGSPDVCYVALKHFDGLVDILHD